MVTILFICIALTIFVLSADMSWSNVLSGRRNNIIFDGRNQDYGAYMIRKENHLNVFYALLLSVGLMGGILAGVYHYSKPLLSEISFAGGIDIVFPAINPLPDTPATENVKKATQAAANTGAKPDGPWEVTDKKDIIQTRTNPMKPDFGDDGKDTGDIQKPFEAGCLTCTGTENGTKQDSVTTKPDVRDWAEVMPQFPGGQAALEKYLADRVNYSSRDQDLGVEGTLFVGCTISPSGGVYDIRIERGIFNGERLAEKATNAFRTMPQWSPGKSHGKEVTVRVVVPIKFELKK